MGELSLFYFSAFQINKNLLKVKFCYIYFIVTKRKMRKLYIDSEDLQDALYSDKQIAEQCNYTNKMN